MGIQELTRECKDFKKQVDNKIQQFLDNLVEAIYKEWGSHIITEDEFYFKVLKTAFFLNKKLEICCDESIYDDGKYYIVIDNKTGKGSYVIKSEKDNNVIISENFNIYKYGKFFMFMKDIVFKYIASDPQFIVNFAKHISSSTNLELKFEECNKKSDVEEMFVDKIIETLNKITSTIVLDFNSNISNIEFNNITNECFVYFEYKPNKINIITSILPNQNKILIHVEDENFPEKYDSYTFMKIVNKDELNALVDKIRQWEQETTISKNINKIEKYKEFLKCPY